MLDSAPPAPLVWYWVRWKNNLPGNSEVDCLLYTIHPTERVDERGYYILGDSTEKDWSTHWLEYNPWPSYSMGCLTSHWFNAGFFSRPTYLPPDCQICPLPLTLAERLQREYLDKGGKHGGGDVGRLPVMRYIEEWIKTTKEKTTCRNYSPRQVGRMINRTNIPEK